LASVRAAHRDDAVPDIGSQRGCCVRKIDEDGHGGNFQFDWML